MVSAVKAKSAEAPTKSLASSQSASTPTAFSSSHAKETHSLVNEEDQRESGAKVPGKREEKEPGIQLDRCKHASKICCVGLAGGMRLSQESPRPFPQALKARTSGQFGEEGKARETRRGTGRNAGRREGRTEEGLV